MRITYWSHSRLADLLRKMFSLPQLPFAASAEEWDEIHDKEQSVSPFGMKLINSLDSIQNIVCWIPDTWTSISYFISNVKNGSHVLRTSVSFGKWGDLVSRIPDALMFSIIDFFEQECFWMNIRWSSKEDRLKFPKEIQDYLNQSYFKRKIFPIKISTELRAKMAREYVDFQIQEGHPDSKEVYNLLWAAYEFAKNRYVGFDAFEETGYYNLPDSGKMFSVTDAQRECFKSIDVLEKEFEEEVTKHCSNIIKYRGYLWT